MLLLLLIAPLILTSNAGSGQKVIQFKILLFHQDSFSLTLPKLNVLPLISALNVLSYGVLWAIDGYTSFTRRSQRSKTWLGWCEYHGRWNSCTAKVWLHGWVVIQLGDAIVDLLKWCSTSKQMVKPSKKLEFDLVCHFHVNRAKILNGSVWTNFFSRLHNCPMPWCER